MKNSKIYLFLALFLNVHGLDLFVSRSSWKCVGKCHAFLVFLASQLDYRIPTDFYRLKKKRAMELGAGKLFSYFRSSPPFALLSLFPELCWKIWRFHRIPTHLINSPYIQNTILDHIEHVFNISHPSKWYNLTVNDITSALGQKTIKREEILDLLKIRYPNYSWYPWQFPLVPIGFWQNSQNNRDYLHHFASSTSIRIPLDWYDVRAKDIILFGNGTSLIVHAYGKSVRRMLSHLFPEYFWERWRFKRVLGVGRLRKENEKVFLDELAGRLHLRDLNGWYDIKKEEVGMTIPRLFEMLKRCYPHHHWEEDKWNAFGKSQKRVRGEIELVFSGEDYFEEYARQCGNSHLLFDFYLPARSLVIEYQGEYHFHGHSPFGRNTITKARDKRKAEICKKAGIHLVSISFSQTKKERITKLKQLI